MNKEIHELISELKKPLPGSNAQNLMMPESRNKMNLQVNSNTKISSILISIYKKNSRYFTVLFKRNEYNGAHSGQVCFPGGKKELSDISLEQTALREAEEELHILQENVTILGKLSPLLIPVSNYLVHPFIGYLNTEPEFVTDPVEVQEIIITSLEEITNPNIRKSKTLNIRGVSYEVPFYKIGTYEIWGATAMIISEFIMILKRINFPHTNSHNVDIAQ